MPCGTKPRPELVIGSIAQAPPSEPIGTRDIDSTPPARTRSSQPERTLAAARLTASRPEAQKRFSWTPATVSGSPAATAAIRAMSEPWSPIGLTTPSTMSSIGGRVEAGEAVAELVDEADDEVDRLGAVQGSVRLAAPARGADGVVDVRFGAQRRAFR